MKRGLFALLLISLALIVAFVACSGKGYTSERSGCSACSLGCVACTACTACAAFSCARGLLGNTQNVTDYIQSFDGN